MSRPKLPEGQHLKPIGVTLKQDHIDWLEKSGNASKLLRRLVDEAMMAEDVGGKRATVGTVSNKNPAADPFA